ncbi:Asparagine synthetase [Candidatus Terasakiella magnetica]|uniref:asparagine synthase (glutamine-hydrolyzing) n=1 Tax=Candidatus Terasakiella magnetica TaxID=1867952 RepID=A0A1C3RG32_9PROT|nr:asparagine synthase (glutamine-hydrolyzing) [Candidatus Terasakiella magnetica]SCA56257.1 Asparagine synthetase [Candidatus Terasakiella magnetica]
MCGIAGLIDLKAQTSTEELSQLTKRMTDTLYHRGPDGGDVWVDGENGIGLGHRRLAIIDLSQAGHQPMTSYDGRFVIVYNGEVYNANDLRPELEAAGYQFNGHSDTEVIVNGFAHWGVKATIEKLIGMFAIAAWDKKEKTFYLVRDRVGIKPLYWAETTNSFLFGSELKALYQHPDCPKEFNRNAIASYLRHNYIPAPLSVFQNIQKLMPGHFLVRNHQGEQKIESFWSLDNVITQNQKFAGSETEAIDQLEDLLKDAVGRRMISDVPLGAFLSGGIDSSTVAALMQQQSDKAIRTFSIGFEEAGYNEAIHAKEVAKHIGTDHTELYVTPSEARDVIPKIADYYDEPFSDSSQIPTYLVSKMTKDHVTVALSGDGGDELFAGYTRYFVGQKLGKHLYSTPKSFRQLGVKLIHSMSPNTWDKIFKIIPERKRPSLPGDKLYKLAKVMDGTKNDFYRRLVSHWDQPENIVLNGKEETDLIWNKDLKGITPDFIDQMQYLDTLTYLPDDILTKVDRASMAVSLEARVPLLDHRLIEYAWSLPQSMKIKDGQGKWALRQVLYRHIPKDLIERPKMGFAVPIDQWLRGPLRDWAEDLLNPQALEETGIFNSAPIQEKWNEHQSGQRNLQYHLWDILMFQSWYRKWMENG